MGRVNTTYSSSYLVEADSQGTFLQNGKFVCRLMEQNEENEAPEDHGNSRESANSADKTHYDITSRDDDEAASKTPSKKTLRSSEER